MSDGASPTPRACIFGECEHENLFGCAAFLDAFATEQTAGWQKIAKQNELAMVNFQQKWFKEEEQTARLRAENERLRRFLDFVARTWITSEHLTCDPSCIHRKIEDDRFSELDAILADSEGRP